MKQYNLLILLALLLSVFAGCSDDDMELNKGDIPLVLNTSGNTIELDANNPEVESLKFTWTSGSNKGTNAAISYTFQMDIQGNNFQDGISIDLGREAYERVYKNEELNEILINDFGIAIDSEATLESRIIAHIAANGVEPEISNVQTLKITTHKPITKTLYLIGDATPNGWSADDATEMKAISGTPKGFSWTGKLTAGKFKFITTLGNFTPSYNKGVDDTKLYFRENDSDPYDEQFEITEGGTYTIKVNLITMMISIVKGEGPEYSDLWFVGDASGWDFVPMYVDPLDPFVFRFNADLSAGGDFKIGTAGSGFDQVFFRPETDATPEGANLDVEKWAGDPDNKWKITGGVYKIKLDTKEMKIDIVPFTPYPMIYLIGNATPSDWVIDNATPMNATGDPYKFTWTGELKAGEFKFTLDKQSDWNGAWFIANEGGKEPTGDVEQMVYNYPGAGPDNKWNIKTAGTYYIELNQLKETVIIKKQ